MMFAEDGASPFNSEDHLSMPGGEQQFFQPAKPEVVQSSNGEHQPTDTEAWDLAEIVERKRVPIRRRRVPPAHGILPKSYHLPNVTLDSIHSHQGDFADIWVGLLDGRKVCVKAFWSQTSEKMDRAKRRFHRDIIGWKDIKHPNVVPFLGVNETLFPFSIVTPWLPGGDIREYICEHRRANRLKLLEQAACGLEYLHSLDIVHGGISPGNILIDEHGTACLGDFGITGVMTNPTIASVEHCSTVANNFGHVRYMAPEFLNALSYKLANSGPTEESDIYSFAMTAYHILTGVLPYGIDFERTIVLCVIRGDRPPRPTDSEWLTERMWAMIQVCWHAWPEHRWDIGTVRATIAESEREKHPRLEQILNLLDRLLLND